MFIRCPACQTLFRIQPQLLKAARGQVRCGSCQAVFDGLDSLVSRDELGKDELVVLSKADEEAVRQQQLPFEDENPLGKANPTEGNGTLPASSIEPPINEKASSPSDTSTKETAHDTALTSPQREDRSAPSEEAVFPPSPPPKPVKIRLKPPRYTLEPGEPEATPRRIAARIGWALGSLLMIAVLAGQIAFHDRERLALDPHWRPWLQMLCDRAGCVLPPQRDPGAIEMIDRNVQSHPQYQNALLITATLVNQAPFPQPYPQVELSMTDLDQKKVASRRFKPSEYLDGDNGQGLIPPGASVRLKLEIADPGQNAVGFEFQFF